MRSHRRLTLARQVLLLQVGVLLVVVAVTGVVSFHQSRADFESGRATRLRAAAEGLAGIAAVQDGLEEPVTRTVLSFYAQQRADITGASGVYLTDTRGVIYAGTDPSRYGERVDLGPRTVLQGRTWTGDVTDAGDRAVAAEVPVLSNGSGEPFSTDAETGVQAGTQVGVAVVVEDYPPLADQLRRAFGDLVVFLAIGLVLGGAGSWLLARLVKRRTRGLEPAEIAALADQREALLASIREGVVAVGPDGTVTVATDTARELLDLPVDVAGRRLAELDLAAPVLRLLDGADGHDEIHDAVLVVEGRAVVVNRRLVVTDGRDAGTVTTLRDRTELMALQSELQVRRSVTDTLRAQTHEFSNQLHTISGLVQLEEYDEVGRLIGTLTRRRAAITEQVTSRVEDPAVAALLVAKSSLADERRVRLVLSDDSRLPRLDPDLSADLTTVVGNLVDNAIDAASDGTSAPHLVQLRLRTDADGVTLDVTDSGPGVPHDLVETIFARGFSTKPADASGRGVGLALVQVVCERRGGSASVAPPPADGTGTTSDPTLGAVFTAVLPWDQL